MPKNLGHIESLARSYTDTAIKTLAGIHDGTVLLTRRAFRNPHQEYFDILLRLAIIVMDAILPPYVVALFRAVSDLLSQPQWPVWRRRDHAGAFAPL